MLIQLLFYIGKIAGISLLVFALTFLSTAPAFVQVNRVAVITLVLACGFSAAAAIRLFAFGARTPCPFCRQPAQLLRGRKFRAWCDSCGEIHGRWWHLRLQRTAMTKQERFTLAGDHRFAMVLGDAAADLRKALRHGDHTHLSKQIDHLRITGWMLDSDDGEGSIDLSGSSEADPDFGEAIELTSDRGITGIDLDTKGRIIGIDIERRPDVFQRLSQLRAG